MAKQNFIAGGFIGKLGDTIGQRWLNKKVIKAYAKPFNPRTEAQQENRRKFGKAVGLSQRAIAFNRGSNIWYQENLIEFAYRIKIAKNRIDQGLDDWLATPLYPDGMTPEVSLINCECILGQNGKWTITSPTLTEQTESRQLYVMIQTQDQITGKTIDQYKKCITTPGSNILVEFDFTERYLPIENQMLIGITCDDNEHENKFWYIPPQPIMISGGLVINDFEMDFGIDTWTIQSRNLYTQLEGEYAAHIKIPVYNFATEQSQFLEMDTTANAQGFKFQNGQSYSNYAYRPGEPIQITTTKATEEQANIFTPSFNTPEEKQTFTSCPGICTLNYAEFDNPSMAFYFDKKWIQGINWDITATGFKTYNKNKQEVGRLPGSSFVTGIKTPENITQVIFQWEDGGFHFILNAEGISFIIQNKYRKCDMSGNIPFCPPNCYVPESEYGFKKQKTYGTYIDCTVLPYMYEGLNELTPAYYDLINLLGEQATYPAGETIIKTYDTEGNPLFAIPFCNSGANPISVFVAKGTNRWTICFMSNIKCTTALADTKDIHDLWVEPGYPAIWFQNYYDTQTMTMQMKVNMISTIQGRYYVKAYVYLMKDNLEPFFEGDVRTDKAPSLSWIENGDFSPHWESQYMNQWWKVYVLEVYVIAETPTGGKQLRMEIDKQNERILENVTE